MNTEIRSFNVGVGQEDSRFVEGYASVFNSRSCDLGGFQEIISPDAFDGVIDKSDVRCLLEHNINRGVLARSKYGTGSLHLETDEHGLKFSFDAPNTALGDEVVEGLRRGDYSSCSFAFTVKDETWSRESDGTYLRTINKIDQLFDTSIVSVPAYDDTSVALRGFAEFRSAEASQENNEPQVEVTETPTEEQPKSDELEVEKTENETKTEEIADEQVEVTEPETTVEETQEPEPETKPEESEPDNTEKRHNNNNKINHMSKFSLIKTINDVINQRGINEDAQEVLNAGAMEMRKAGLAATAPINLPVQEFRADGDSDAGVDAVAATYATQGQEAVATDKLNILGPLYADSILAKVGATFMTGLTNNVSIPTYSGTQAGWKGELEEADNGRGDFDTIELSPKRLTAYVNISRQMLIQDSVGVEEMLRNDIVNAIKDKLEATILGSAAGDTTKPAGIFYNVDADNPSYGGVATMEANLEGSNFNGEKVWIMSPAAKAEFKMATVSGTKSDLRTLYQDGEVEGYPVYVSSNVAGFALGDFRELIVAQWGGLSINVDTCSLSLNDAVRLVVNGYFDAVVRRDGAIEARVLPSDSD